MVEAVHVVVIIKRDRGVLGHCPRSREHGVSKFRI